jgi:hypothetical protein
LLVVLVDPGVAGAVTTHDLWFHDCLGWFAVRLEGTTVTGVAGLLSWHQALDWEFDPATCTFDESEWATRRARNSPEQFMPLEKWLRGGTDYRPLLVEVALGYLDE